MCINRVHHVVEAAHLTGPVSGQKLSGYSCAYYSGLLLRGTAAKGLARCRQSRKPCVGEFTYTGRASVDETVLQGVARQLDVGRQRQLAGHAAAVGGDGLFAELQAGSDLFDCLADCDQAQHFQLTR